MIDLSVEELGRVREVQDLVTRRYANRPDTAENLLMMMGELKGRMADIGLVVETSLQPTPLGMQPMCDIVGRTDPRREREIAEEGMDVERQSWEAARTSSRRLRDEGLDPGMLAG